MSDVRLASCRLVGFFVVCGAFCAVACDRGERPSTHATPLVEKEPSEVRSSQLRSSGTSSSEDRSAETPSTVRPPSPSLSDPAGSAPAEPFVIGSDQARLGVLQGYGSGYGVGSARTVGGRLARKALVRGGPAAQFNREGYAHRTDNTFIHVSDQPLSTFSIDVDTASYSNVRRFILGERRLPPADAVRVEEFINYFRYDYPEPVDDAPFALTTEVASSPWHSGKRLVLVGLKAKSLPPQQTPPRNLVFLVDVSGSMSDPDKLPLLKQSLALLARQLRPEDRIAIVVYAGASGVVLPSTRGSDQGRILAALQELEAGGSTNGGEGIELAYRLARSQFVNSGINRVLLATDGDFNVGVTSHGELVRLIERERESGVFLTVLGFGAGNLQDETMELLADKGNGHYAYIDSLAEARKVLVREAGSTLVTVAKDVKLQVEFNPARVRDYRLIGYENRLLAAQDFNDDHKDAGEMGAGHSVTALYEITPVGGTSSIQRVDPLRYQGPRDLSARARSSELLTVAVRYKLPNASTSTRRQIAVADSNRSLSTSSENLRWAAATAGFGMLLRNSPERGQTDLPFVHGLARGALGRDASGDRREFITILERAMALRSGTSRQTDVAVTN